MLFGVVVIQPVEPRCGKVKEVVADCCDNAQACACLYGTSVSWHPICCLTLAGKL